MAIVEIHKNQFSSNCPFNVLFTRLFLFSPLVSLIVTKMGNFGSLCRSLCSCLISITICGAYGIEMSLKTLCLIYV